MKRILSIVSLTLLCVLGPTTCIWAQYPRAYNYYMEMAKEALHKKNYKEALNYFNHAHLVNPSQEDPIRFVNLLKRLTDNRIEIVTPQKAVPPGISSPDELPSPPVGSTPEAPQRNEIIAQTLDSLKAKKEPAFLSEAPTPDELPSPPVGSTPETPQRNEIIAQTLDSLKAKKEPAFLSETPTPDELPAAPIDSAPETPQRNEIIAQTLDSLKTEEKPSPASPVQPASTTITVTRKTAESREPMPIYLNNALWATQPKTLLQIELNTSVILEGEQIDRFLVITPGFIETGQIDRNHLKITAKKRGSTFLHVWDNQGRWTFNVEVIFALPSDKTTAAEDTKEIRSKPFRLSYSSDWGSFYRGQSLDQVQRQNLNFLQWGGLSGETPYGDFDSYVIANKFDTSTEVTGYSVGLTNGHWEDFDHFTIRGFDNAKTFSALTVPGQYFRGVLLESPAFHDNIKYTFIKGRDRATYGFLAPNVLEKRDSFVEGFKLTLFPKEDNQYSLNWARGYGSARDSFLKERVASVQAQHRFNRWLLAGENAYDEDTFARTVSSKFDRDNFHFFMNFRDIDREFSTITSLPSNRGEIGGMLGFNWNLSGVDLATNLDLYQDRYLPNEDDPKAINLDFSSSSQIPLSQTERLSSSLFYINTPGELSPRENLRLNNTYSRRFSLGGDRQLNTFLGSTYQMSRYKFSPTSEYDRYSLISGFNLPLAKSLSYYANYESSWVNDLSTSTLLRPAVLTTGLSYNKTLPGHWTMHTDFAYRDEERTEGLNSFLAGEDSTIGSVGLSYKPTVDFEFFIDGRVRNVWAESNQSAAYNEVDIRSGIRSAWDLPVLWNPSGQIEGIVFKDLNNNKKHDANESGIANVLVKVGKKQATTDMNGHYKASVRAKSVEVSVDMKTIPSGFIFSTPALVNMQIANHRTQHVDFGLTTNSGIYGVLFFDENKNGKPDANDMSISKGRIILDGKESAVTDFEGNYFFSNIAAGTHQITIDVNSLPLEYLPAIKIKNDVKVSEGTTYIFYIPLNKNPKVQK